MSQQADILLVGQTPPPFHGQSVVTGMLFDHRWDGLKVERLRMAYSDTIDAVGKAGLGKVIHLLGLILKTWWMALSKRPQILYYLPASANRTPVIRDIIYLGAVRWLFPKTVFHYHAGGLPEYLETAGLLGKLARQVYSGADLSVEISKTEHSPGRLFSAHKTIHVSNGLDVEPLPRSRTSDAELRVLFLGALNEGKGVLDVIRAAKMARSQGCRFHVEMVGAWSSDAFRKEAEKLVADAQLTDFVRFPGPMKGAEKWQAYADADVFIFPSHYEAENFPLVLIEAMAFGLPVVSTNWRGIPQLVGDSGAAMLLDIHAPEQYAEALRSLAGNAELRLEMGQTARAHYLQHYTRGAFVGAMEAAFRSVLDAGEPGSLSRS
ncbi:MAG: glycosyltransferase family 4 protein [Akkermansiaceae bacterium]|nr:glycosyltransferase family 4 protein [Akkermansiaceae bacterium]